ncbi:MFS transporter [Brevibacillus reuszeri]|uniref:MFS transporter n=1 Tax=Brevibacillus reuszeri TaxID=54915 RepID=A0A0K9Z1L1_9BACL|nr:MFS transporter [Brevibacillus reuszeri]KNB74792.1 MFS transporter [Brevibacillus reuszeri]MED1859559.1 MFS transporter [Brevibacillus reuszeri]GED71941.1 MFS transporter [Brevibacillus reuszeri]
MGEVFRNQNFRRLFFSNLFSGFGQGMTMIGISWYLVEATGSASLLGSTMLLSSILTLLVGPYSGTLIDRFSRKAILQIEQLGGFVVLALLAVWGFWGSYHEWMLVLLYMATLFMFQIHEPAQAAFVQETFTPKHYKAINSLLEIENQTALVLAGGFAGMILGKFGLHVVLLFNALTYLIAFLMLSGIDYVFTLGNQAEKSPRRSWVEQFYQSWVYIRERRGFMIFGVSALVPFIAVMLANLLNPIFVSQVLREDVKIYSLGEVTYSIGAVGAGIMLAWFSRKLGAFSYMVLNYVFMAIVFVLTIAIPNGWVFVLLSAFIGWCNVSTRLIRQTLYMELLPNRYMGRVMSFFKSIGTLMRLTLLALFTVMLDSTGTQVGYVVLASFLILAALGILFSMRLLMRQVDKAETVTGQGSAE